MTAESFQNTNHLSANINWLFIVCKINIIQIYKKENWAIGDSLIPYEN